MEKTAGGGTVHIFSFNRRDKGTTLGKMTQNPHRTERDNEELLGLYCRKIFIKAFIKKLIYLLLHCSLKKLIPN